MEAITDQEKADFRDILSIIFGPQAEKWQINLAVLELLGELMQSSDSCSRYMDMVPRPFAGGNVSRWASKQFREAIVRQLKNGGTHYLLCLRAIGLKMKSRFHLASQGH